MKRCILLTLTTLCFCVANAAEGPALDREIQCQVGITTAASQFEILLGPETRAGARLMRMDDMGVRSQGIGLLVVSVMCVTTEELYECTWGPGKLFALDPVPFTETDELYAFHGRVRNPPAFSTRRMRCFMYKSG